METAKEPLAFRVRMNKDGRITIAAEQRRMAGWKPGDIIAIWFDKRRKAMILRKVVVY